MPDTDAELKAKINDLKAQIKDLKAQREALKKAPAKEEKKAK